MNGFFEFFEGKGIKDIRDSTAFVRNFLQDPSIFFDLTEAERNGMEKRLNEALAFFKIEKS
jgi:hypothetical protein